MCVRIIRFVQLLLYDTSVGTQFSFFSSSSSTSLIIDTNANKIDEKWNGKSILKLVRKCHAVQDGTFRPEQPRTARERVGFTKP